MTGFAIVTVTNDLKITDIKVYYNPEAFLRVLRGEETNVDAGRKSHEATFSSWMEDQDFKVGESITPSIIRSAEADENFNGKIDRGAVVDWKNDIPSYALVDLAFYKGRTKAYVEGSVEYLISNIVKRCEMEISYTKQIDQRKVFASGTCSVEVNGVDITSSFDGFKKSCSEVFNGAYPWEVTEVFSSAPEIAFSWRHWMEPQSEESSEIKGFAFVKVNDDFKVESMKLFYKPQDVPEKFLVGSGTCPFGYYCENANNVE